MQHLIVEFRHSIRDVIPFSEFVQNIRPILAETGTGEYLYDDMAIDGGDAEAFFACQDASVLFNLIEPQLRALSCMRQAKITLVFGQLDSDAQTQHFILD